MRKTKLVVITGSDDNRDKGKHFLITEMDADKAEKWGLRALLLAAQHGADIPDHVKDSGMVGVAIMGVQSILGGIKFNDVEPLLEEMFSCIQIIPDMKNNPEFIRKLIADDIEEVSTRAKLRAEVFDLHAGFSIGELLLIFIGKAKVERSSDIQMSQS